MDLYAKRTLQIDTENAFKIGPHICALESKGKSVIRLNVGEPNFDVPDFIKAELIKQIRHNNTHYCDPRGLLSLREAIRDQIQITRQIKVSPEQIVVFPGAKPAIGFSQQVYCNPGDEIIYPSPGFPIYESFIHYLDAKPVPYFLEESNGFIFTAEKLAELLTPKTKLIFLNFPSNPTGGLTTQAELEAIAKVILSKCDQHVRIYSDEIYENIIFDGAKHFSIASIPGMQDKTIISSGFSKTFSWTGGRVGYAVLPSIEEADIFKNLNINYFTCVPPYNQEAARIALTHPDSQKLIAERCHILEQRRDFVYNALNTIPNIHCQKPKGAFYFFINVEKVCDSLGVSDAFHALDNTMRDKTSPSTLLQMFCLFYHQVAVLDRRSFGKVGADNDHFLRLSFGGDLEQLDKGVRALSIAFQDKTGFAQFMKSGKHLCS